MAQIKTHDLEDSMKKVKIIDHSIHLPYIVASFLDWFDLSIINSIVALFAISFIRAKNVTISNKVPDLVIVKKKFTLRLWFKNILLTLSGWYFSN